MDYKRTSRTQIEVILGSTPSGRLLETIARVSYDLARPLGSGWEQLFDTPPSEVDFTPFIKYEEKVSEVPRHRLISRFVSSKRVVERGEPLNLHMGYVNGRHCHTQVHRTDNGNYVFEAVIHEMDRGSADLFMEKVKSALELEVEGAKIETQAEKPPYWDRVEVVASELGIKIDSKKAHESRLKVALELDRRDRVIEAVEVASGRDYKRGAMNDLLILQYKTTHDTPENFYRGFGNIDRT